MKKIFPVAIIAVFVILTFTTSCKKTNSSGQYTCSCTFKGSATGADTTEKTTYPTGSTQSEATAACNSLQTTYQVIDSAASCHL